MIIYDISQEVFGCRVFPGDPVPERIRLGSIEDGGVCNLTAFSMCAHNGTHVDAPYHFIKDGKTVDAVDLDAFVGAAYVAGHEGTVTAADAAEILEKAKECDPGAARRILIKGPAVISAEAAEVFAESGILLLGNESQTVGPEDAPMQVHLILLGAGVVLLEGIRLAAVADGVYFLNAAPLNLSGADGSPCRALLIKNENKFQEVPRNDSL
ncbi:MAG: cyclase family protein [Clostridia bacterium]|nr:cyclase family protein [Clostridia bacterium]